MYSVSSQHHHSPRSLYRACFETLTPNVAADLLVYGKERLGTISLAQGEGTAPTPRFIQEAVAQALLEGKTHYGPVLGNPILRQEIASYHSRIFGHDIPLNRVVVTTSGTTAVHLAIQSLIDPGDEIVVLTPIWKNLVGMMELARAKVVEVCMDEEDGAWSLDSEKLFSACMPRTKAILLVSPNNPTGWVMSSSQIKDIQEFARNLGIWIIADEVYARCMYTQTRSPSFLDSAYPDDRLYVVNSFSKSWAMTGWRMGWMICPSDAEEKLRDLILYETMGPPAFTQYGALAALRHGEEFIKEQLSHWEKNLDMVMNKFEELPRVRMARPAATFYAFFKVEGEPDSMSLARRLIDEAGVSLAPGASFGSSCPDYLRLCFGAAPEVMEEALNRLEKVLR